LTYDGILNPQEVLQNFVEMICKARGTSLDEFQALDRFGNLVGFETQLHNVVGSEIVLKKKGQH